MSLQILKGNIIFTKEHDHFEILENGYIVSDGDTILDVTPTLSQKYNGVAVTDYGDCLIIPGFVDVHAHAPQFENRGIGYDKELLPWLETYTFPEENKFSDLAYAEKIYTTFVDHLYENGTTRSILFGTIHKESTLLLGNLLAKKGLGAFVGKVNMDQNAPPFLTEDTLVSLKETEEYIQQFAPENSIVKPIITPRFVPTCSSELMEGLGVLAKKYNLPVQSHLSENTGEIAWVKELHPDCETYGHVYEKHHLFGETPTIMAHCVSSTAEEINLMKEQNVFVAHCPDSNIDLSSGIAPIRKYLNAELSIGLGSDISGGHDLFLPRAIVAAIQSSKLYQLYVDREDAPLNTAEGFYLATKGGGQFFGNVGSFEKDYALDALVIDDSAIKGVNPRTVEERLQKFLYTGSKENIAHIYVNGKKIK